MNADDDHPHFNLGFVDLFSDSDEDDNAPAVVPAQSSVSAEPDLPVIHHLDTLVNYPSVDSCVPASIQLDLREAEPSSVISSSQGLPVLVQDSELMPPPRSTEVKKTQHQVKQHSFKAPMDELSLETLSNKQFSDETR